MNYPRKIVPYTHLHANRRVYIEELCVFGRVKDMSVIICEAPMEGYAYRYDFDSILYDEAIGDRDPHDPPSE